MLRLTVIWVLVCLFFASPCLSQTEHPRNDDPVTVRESERVCLSEVLIGLSQSHSPAQDTAALHKAEGVRNAAQAGSSFAYLAKTNSQGPSAARGGAIGCFKRGQLPKQLEDRVFNMQAGDVSDPLRTKRGYIVLQVTEHSAP